MKRRIQVGGSPYVEDGGFTFTEAAAEATSVDPEFPIIEVPEGDWQRWLSIQDFKELYNAFSKLALDESVRIGNEQHRRQAELEQDIQKLKSGSYKLVPISKLDMDRELFDNCTTFEEVNAILAGLPPGSEIELAAIPSKEQLDHRRQCKEEMIRRGIDPMAPVRTILDP